MAKRGPKPKPTALRILEGNPGRKPLYLNEPIVEEPARKPPIVAADKIASEEWDRLVRIMPPDLYSAADVAVMAQYALAWSMLVKAQCEIDAYGVVIRSESGSVPNPAVRIWKTASETLARTASLLGLWPGARSRLGIPKQGNSLDSGRFAGLLGARKPS